MGGAPDPFRYRNALLGYTTGLITSWNTDSKIEPNTPDPQVNAILKENQYNRNFSAGTTTIQNVEQYTEGGVNKYNFNFAGRYDFIKPCRHM